MKAYVITTGALFGLLALVHLWRIVEEGMRLASDPGFIIATAVAAALCLWSWQVLRRAGRSSRP
jgi:hypothetical protein